MKMSLSPTNCRTVPDASVLNITFGRPSGRTFMAAVPIVVPGRSADGEHAGHLTFRVRHLDELRRAGGSSRHRFAAVRARLDLGERHAGQLEQPFARDVSLDRWRSDRAGVDQRDRHAPRCRAGL